MKSTKMLLLLTGAALLMQSAMGFAANRLVVNASELGVGKFHRYDNGVHPYPANSAWAPFILAKDASDATPIVQKNTDGSVTIFFSNLDELLTAVVKVSKDAGQKISVLNVHGHGLPGAMWYPKDAATQASGECSDWRDAANNSDDVNYNKYYEPVPKYEIMMIRQMSDGGGGAECTSGVPEWQAALAGAHADVKSVLADDLQVHFLSCVVGLGSVGEQYTVGMATLLAGTAGRVSTSMNFGLGDWSMPDGMGFWDYQTDEQLDHDNGIYPVNKRDADIAQLGSVRMVTAVGTTMKSGIVPNLKVMPLTFEARMPNMVTSNKATLSHLDSFGNPVEFFEQLPMPLPARIHIPGTAYTVRIK
jgi:hypothetical protein